MNNKPKIISKFSFDLTPSCNGGESFCFIGEIWDDGDNTPPDEVYMISKFVLNSYGNEAIISGFLVTPEKLRELANQIEVEMNKAKQMMEQ